MDFKLLNIIDIKERLATLDYVASKWREVAEHDLSACPDESLFIKDCHIASMYQAEADALRRKIEAGEQ